MTNFPQHLLLIFLINSPVHGELLSELFLIAYGIRVPTGGPNFGARVLLGAISQKAPNWLQKRPLAPKLGATHRLWATALPRPPEWPSARRWWCGRLNIHISISIIHCGKCAYDDTGRRN